MNSIKPRDISELSKMRKVSDTTALIMDTIHILLKKPLDRVSPKDHYILKTNIPFVNDSFDNHTKKTLGSTKFL